MNTYKKVTIIMFAALVAVGAWFLMRTNVERDMAKAIPRGMKVSVWIKELESGKEHGIRENDAFVAASLMKVPLMAAYLVEAQATPGFLDSKAVFLPEIAALSAGLEAYPPIRDRMVLNGSYSVDELLGRLITSSDNDAGAMLEASVPKSILYDTVSALLGEPYEPGMRMSPKQYGTILESIHAGKILDETMTGKAVYLLSSTEYDRALVARLPDGVKVAHKFGVYRYEDTGVRGINDCGIVYAENPYIICVMAMGGEHSELEGAIAGISLAAYNILK